MFCCPALLKRVLYRFSVTETGLQESYVCTKVLLHAGPNIHGTRRWTGSGGQRPSHMRVRYHPIIFFENLSRSILMYTEVECSFILIFIFRKPTSWKGNSLNNNFIGVFRIEGLQNPQDLISYGPVTRLWDHYCRRRECLVALVGQFNWAVITSYQLLSVQCNGWHWTDIRSIACMREIAKHHWTVNISYIENETKLSSSCKR